MKLAMASLVTASALLGGVSACTIHGSAEVQGPAVEVDEEPPPPPPRPVVVVRPGSVWIEGHYDRVGNRWVWRDGYYERERRGSVYIQGHWETVGPHRKRWVAGHWR